MNCGKKIPDTLILVIYLPPAMLFFWFFSKNSRYANFSNLSTPSYAIFDRSKNSRYADFSAVFTPNYAIVNCVKKFRYTDFSPYYLTHREVAYIFVWTPSNPIAKGNCMKLRLLALIPLYIKNM